MPSGKNILFFVFLAALALGQGCSSSPTAGNEEYLEAQGGSESGADAVGSIPEDMLANDEASAGTDATIEGGEAEAAPATDEGSPDPFADLKEDESKADALAVSESGEGSQATGATDTYTVKHGDTLMKIAFSIYGDIDRWKDLRDWNQSTIKGANHLKVGTKLTYEAPLHPFSAQELSHSYEIKPGDTLAGIAAEVYGRRMKYRKLQRFNQSLIKNPNRIFAGFTIFYDITDKEMAEAEARRQERMAGGQGMGGGQESVPEANSMIPSAVSPPAEAAPASRPPVATAPSGAIAPPSSGTTAQPIAPPGPASMSP